MNESAEQALANEREYDAAALRIAERVRSSLELEEVLVQTLHELGHATGISRALIQLAPDEEGVCRLLEWYRGDTSPLNVVPPTPVARRVFETREPLVIDNVADADEELGSYLRSVGSVSAIAYPIRWQGEISAVIGFEDSVKREWRERALPLLQRLEAQLAAALAQAELFRQQQDAIRRLEEIDRMREELIANVSHELRTPLTAIIGVIKTLRRSDTEFSEEQRDALLVVLEEQAHRLHLLAEDLLDLARFRRGVQRLKTAELSFSDLIARALMGLEIPADRELVVRIEDELSVDADPSRMAQVLANLIGNAVRHGEGEITVRCFHDGERAVIHVGDQGDGVAPDFAEAMFEPFSHNGSSPESTGLGLPIARAIVEAHGGNLVYLAAGDEEPHQFVVTLPAGPKRD